MPDFEAGVVVRVPFPYTDRDTRQHRPALVVASGLGPDAALLWVLMITSAENRRWPGDVPIDTNHAACGLPVASLIRTTKIATIEARVAQPLGMIAAEQWIAVHEALADHLGQPPHP